MNPNPTPMLTPMTRVLVAGATGLVGRQALRQLLMDAGVQEVRVLLRRPVGVPQLLGPADAALARAAQSKLRLCVGDFGQLAKHLDWFEVDTVLCALGTTIKKAGSQAAFREVDHDYPLQIAHLALAQGAQRYLLVSALGANAQSKVFYNRVKGELENAIRAQGWPQVCVAQPSLLAGDRAEFRLGERLALGLGWLFPEPYKPVQAAQVAAGLLASAKSLDAGWHVLSNTALRRMR
jgi:uncharacterized protein YbjT (DUF2867 family)